MYIITPIADFLKTCREKIYQGVKEKVRKHYNIPDGQTLYYNGYWDKPMIYIDQYKRLETIDIPIRRLLLIKESGEKVHIYVKPFFVLKYAPFPLNDLERIYVECISHDIEPFEIIDDPKQLLESSLPYETWINRLDSNLQENKFQARWARLFYNTFHTLPQVDSQNSFLSQCLDLIADFVNRLGIKSHTNYDLFS